MYKAGDIVRCMMYSKHMYSLTFISKYGIINLYFHLINLFNFTLASKLNVFCLLL